MKKILLSAYLLTTSFLLHASGFQVNTQGQKALGLAGAYTALSRDASAVFYNPAAMAMLDSGMISIGSTVLRPQTAFRSASTGRLAETETKLFFPSYLYANYAINDKFAAGISVNSPYGLGTKWPDNWEGRNVLQEVNLQTLYVQPTLSYQLTDRFSVGAGLVIANGNFMMRRQIGEINADAELSSRATGLGFNAGVYGRIQERVSFGITYRSAVKLDLNNGDAAFTNVPGLISGQFPAKARFTSDLTLPSTLSVGIADQVNEKILLSFDFNLTGWSSYDSLNFVFPEGSTPNSRTGRRYEDAMAFRIGAEYRYNEKLTLRLGVLYDESPIRDEYISPEFPDGNRLGGTAGFTYKLSNRLALDAAYVFEDVAKREVKDPTNNTVSNVGGAYKTYVNGFGIGLSYNFNAPPSNRLQGNPRYSF